MLPDFNFRLFYFAQCISHFLSLLKSNTFDNNEGKQVYILDVANLQLISADPDQGIFLFCRDSLHYCVVEWLTVWIASQWHTERSPFMDESCRTFQLIEQFTELRDIAWICTDFSLMKLLLQICHFGF